MCSLTHLAVFLLSPQAEYLNGQTIAIDGGQYQATGGNFSRLLGWTDEDWAKARESITRKDASDRAQRTV